MDQGDIDFINKQMETKMDNSYNKVQYSEFTPDRVGQWVLRGDTVEEVMRLREELFGKQVTAKPIAQAPVVNPTTTKRAQTSNAPSCPNCGGLMWDNRPKKRSGEYNLASPDFKCRDKACGGVIWPPKEFKKKNLQADGSDYPIDY